MHIKLDEFYRSVLGCCGIKVTEDGQLLDDDNDPVVTKAGKQYYLPYKEVLKKPKGKQPYHPLNENYRKPESEAFNMTKTNLTMHANTCLVGIMSYLMGVGGDVDKCKLIKSTGLIEFFDGLDEIEIQTTDFFATKIFPRAIEANGVAAVFKIFVKKDGKIGDRDYKAIAKINFTLYDDICRALEEKGDYKILDGLKCRKKDLVIYKEIFERLIPNIDKPDTYMVGTDNKVFRLYNVLLKAIYPILAQINEYAELLEEDLGKTDDSTKTYNDLAWASLLEEIYKLTEEIERIPNQDDIAVEAKRLDVDESEVANVERSDRTSKREKKKAKNFIPPPRDEEEEEEEDDHRRRRYRDQIDDEDDEDDDDGSSLDDLIMGRRRGRDNRKKRHRHPDLEPDGWYDEDGNWVEENPRLLREKRRRRDDDRRRSRRQEYRGDLGYDPAPRRGRRDRYDDDYYDDDYDDYYDRRDRRRGRDRDDDDERRGPNDGYWDKEGYWVSYDDDRRGSRRGRSSSRQSRSSSFDSDIY